MHQQAQGSVQACFLGNTNLLVLQRILSDVGAFADAEVFNLAC